MMCLCLRLGLRLVISVAADLRPWRCPFDCDYHTACRPDFFLHLVLDHGLYIELMDLDLDVLVEWAHDLVERFGDGRGE